MTWLVFSYSLPSKGQSSPRVALWRRLQRLGSVSVTGGVYLLPDQPDALEGFQWLAQEVESAGGEALVMRAERLENVTDADIIARFNAARGEDYRDLERLADEALDRKTDGEALGDRFAVLERLRKRYAEIARIDFFGAPGAAAVDAKLTRLTQTFEGERSTAPDIEKVDAASFKERIWVTRPRPHVDRLASIWLIRRFIDADATISYRDAVEEGEVSFDMTNAQFGHVGIRCTFETLIAAFGLSDPVLEVMAQIVHEIDLRDGRSARPEVPGVDAVLEGWRRLDLTDEALEVHGIVLFEGLYSALSKQPSMAAEASIPSEAKHREA